MLLFTSVALWGMGGTHACSHNHKHNTSGCCLNLSLKLLKMNPKLDTAPSHIRPLFSISSLDQEDALKCTENEDARDFHRACWELEFLPIAQKLIKILQPVVLTA